MGWRTCGQLQIISYLVIYSISIFWPRIKDSRNLHFYERRRGGRRANTSVTGQNNKTWRMNYRGGSGQRPRPIRGRIWSADEGQIVLARLIYMQTLVLNTPTVTLNNSISSASICTQILFRVQDVCPSSYLITASCYAEVPYDSIY